MRDYTDNELFRVSVKLRVFTISITIVYTFGVRQSKKYMCDHARVVCCKIYTVYIVIICVYDIIIIIDNDGKQVKKTRRI